MAAQKTPSKKRSAQRSEGAKTTRRAARPPTLRRQATPIVRVRTSERRAFKRCPQRWWWAYREGLESKRQKDALWFGTGIHEALATYYGKPGLKRGPHPAETWKKWCGEEYRTMRVGSDFDEQAYVDARALGIAMLEGYVKEYKDQEDWLSMVAVEQPFEIEMVRGDGSVFLYNGTFDGVYRDLRTGHLWLLEHKTAKTISDAHLPLDDQAGSYLMVATEILRDKGVLGSSEEIKGILYNFLRKQLPDERPIDPVTGLATNKPKKEHFLEAFKRAGLAANPKMALSVMQDVATQHGLTVLGEVSATQQKPNFERFPIWREPKSRLVMADRIVAEEAAMGMYRSGALPLYKTPTRDCSWDCDFFEMCDLHEQGGDWEEMKTISFRTRDPYYDHRKSASEGL
jgi:hypothetical protein